MASVRHHNVVVFLIESGMLNALPGVSILTRAVENNHVAILKNNIFGMMLCDIHQNIIF